MTARRNALLPACALCLTLGSIQGCTNDPRLGYSFHDTWDDEDIASVAVPLMTNSTYTRGIEVLLTEAVNKRIQSLTPWSIQPERVADTVLTARITEADLRRLSTDRGTGLAEEYAYVITVSYEWKDARTGEVLVSRQNFRESSTFVPEIRTGGTIGDGNEPLEIGQYGAIDAIATAIVRSLRSSW